MIEDLIIAHQKRPQYTTTFVDGTVVYFHLLSNKEYDALTAIRKEYQLDDNVFYEYVFNFCVPNEWKNIGGNVRAGIPRSIGEFIYFHSMNYENLELELEHARAKYQPNEIYEQMKIVIMTAFPNYKIEELDEKDRPSIIRLFVRAETVLEIKTDGKYKPFNMKKAKAIAEKKSSGIDFNKENSEIQREFGKAGTPDDPFSRNGSAFEIAQIREHAARRAEIRREKIKNG